MTDRRIEVVYCDDIRAEVGNKHSLIGVYTGDLFISTMPVVLPKLCAWVNVITPVSSPFSELRIRVLHDDTVLIDTGNLFEDGTQSPPPNENGQRQVMVVNFSVTLSPFQIDGESLLRIVADTEDGELKSRPLRIRKGAPAASPK